MQMRHNANKTKCKYDEMQMKQNANSSKCKCKKMQIDKFQTDDIQTIQKSKWDNMQLKQKERDYLQKILSPQFCKNNLMK